MRVLVFLLLYSLSFALPEIITTMCPSTFTVKGEALTGCEQVCKKVQEKGSLHDRPLIGVIGPKEFGVQNGITYFDNTCTCVFGDKRNPPADYIYCSYKVEHKKLSATRIDLKGPESLGDTDIPTNLVKMFIFDKSGSGTSAGDIIFSGLYTVYTQAIKGFSVAFALALTIIVAGWTFGTYFFTNFLQVLRSRHGHLEFAISSDLKSKAQTVLLASLVFLVPLNTNSPILKAAGVGYPKGADKHLIQGCNVDPDTIDVNSIAECNLPLQVNCPVCQDYLTQIRKNCEKIKQKEQEPDNNTGIDKRVHVSHLRNQNLLLAEGYKMCVKTFNERQKKNQDQQAESYEKYPRWLRPESIQKDIQATYLPTAVAVVKSFISTGLGFAQGVGAFAGDVVQAYVLKKLSRGDSYKALGMPSMKEQEEQVKQMIQELEAKEKINISGCALFTSYNINTCSKFRKLDAMGFFDYKHKEANCGAIIEAVANYCDKLDLDAITSKKKTLQHALNSAKNEQQLLTEQTAQAFNSIRTSMTWLSPAVIPLVSIYVQVAKFSGVKNDPPQTTIILVGGSRPKNLGWIGATLRAGEEAFDKLVSGIKGVGSALFDGPVANIASETKDVGWDVLVKGNYGSRAFFIGRVFGLTSIPPGSIIKNGLNTLAGAAGNVLGFIGIAGVTASAFLMGLVPATVLGLALFAIGKVTGIATTVIITLASAVITAMFLNAIPLIAVAIVVIFRFLAYLKDLIKYMLSLPFFAVAAATRDAGGVFEAFRELIKLTLMPAVIAFTPLVGFAAVELTMFFAYDLPMALLNSAIATFAGDNILFLFAVGYFTGVLYVIITFLSALVGWEISMAFIDSITEFIQRVAGGTASASSRAIASALTILRPTPRM